MTDAIDAADRAEAYDNEPAPNGAWANQGSYGNTPEASKSVLRRSGEFLLPSD
jgi:hypothetical protein